MPGAISIDSALVKNANSIWLNDKPLKKDLEKFLNKKVTLENDANCFALSEAVDGAGKNCDVVFGVILGTGVGGGIVINKKIIKGRNKISGEWGHMPLPNISTEERELSKECYNDHSICISGESGAGKTECAKLCLIFLTEIMAQEYSEHTSQ